MGLIIFDYSHLDTETRIFVKQRSSEIRTLMKRTAQSVIEIGEKLIEVKNQLPHGSFGEWLEIEFEWGTSQAARFMQVAERFGDKIYQIDKFSPSALYLLAAPSTPDEARAEAISRAEDGERVTHQAAKQIVNEHKPAQPISPVTFSADGKIASVTVANGDVAGGLAAVMEAEPPALMKTIRLTHSPKLENGYAVYPCHVCQERRIQINPVAGTVACEACGNTWDKLSEYHAERQAWVLPASSHRQPKDNPSHLECQICGGNVLFQVEQALYRCHQCAAEWSSVAEMYTELIEKWRTARRQLDDLKGLAQVVVVY